MTLEPVPFRRVPRIPRLVDYVLRAKPPWHARESPPTQPDPAAPFSGRLATPGERRRALRMCLAGAICAVVCAQDTPEYRDRAWRRRDGLPHDTVRALLQTRDGYLWAATSGGTVRFDGQTFFHLNRVAFPQMASDRCRALAEDGSFGLARSDRGTFRHFPVRPQPGMDDAYCLTLDRDGGLWIGTETDGLHCWRPRFLDTLSAADGLAHDTVWALCESPHAGLWIGTEAGLSRFHEGRFQTVPSPDRLPNPVVRALAPDPAGALWIGTGNGLARLHQSEIAVWRFTGYEPGDSAGKSRNKVRAIQPTRDGAVWVAVPTGLYRVYGSQETFFDVTRRGEGGLPHSDVRALLETRAGTVWVGTAGGGVARMVASGPDGDGFRFASYDTADGLSSDFVLTLHEDEDRSGVLWIGTERGLNRLPFPAPHAASTTPATPSAPPAPSPALPLPTGAQARPVIRTFGTRQGLPSDRVNFILEDGQGRLWVSHDRGIYRVRKSDLDAVAAGQRPWVPCVNYDEADGMLARETSGERCQPAGCRARDGRLWFATAKGVVAIDPSRVQTNAVPPPVAVEQVIADGELVYAQGAGLAAALADRRAEPEPPERRPGVRRTLGPSFRLPHLDEIGQTARDSLRTLSQTIWTLEPVSASLARVADYIGDFAQRLFSAAGVRCRVEVPPNWPDAELGARERHAVLAAAKESFYNILKHAAATEVQLRFEVAERAFRLTIQDNGRGFAAGLPPPNLKPEISNSKPTSGHGLRNLALRLTELGGHFRCDSRPGQGTTAVISIPLTSPPAGAQTADANSP